MKKKLLDLLFSEQYKTYVVLDSAAANKVNFNVNHAFNTKSLSLYLDKDKEDLEEVAPYLVELSKETGY